MKLKLSSLLFLFEDLWFDLLENLFSYLFVLTDLLFDQFILISPKSHLPILLICYWFFVFLFQFVKYPDWLWPHCFFHHQGFFTTPFLPPYSNSFYSYVHSKILLDLLFLHMLSTIFYSIPHSSTEDSHCFNPDHFFLFSTYLFQPLYPTIFITIIPYHFKVLTLSEMTISLFL